VQATVEYKETVDVLGVDLAWRDNRSSRPNETGVAAVSADGQLMDAGWVRGLTETVAWIDSHRERDVLVMVDAPLVVTNERGQRTCDTHTGQRYGRWKVSANSTNLASPRQAGTVLRQRLEALGWIYDPGWNGPPRTGRVVSECYPYTTLVGGHELGYDVERPVYKRKPKKIRVTEFRPGRAEVCDDLLSRLDRLAVADPPLRLRSHPETAALLSERSPYDREYKHREDLIDAVLCAWTGLLWLRHGFDRCQVLGDPGPGPVATIIAPSRAAQRR